MSKNTAPAPRERQRELLDRQRPEGCSIRRGFEVIELPRSTFYYRSTSAVDGLSDERLIEMIGDVQDELPGYGYRRVTRELQRRRQVVNHRRISRVMKAHGPGIRPRRRFVRTTDSDHDLPIFPSLYRNVIPALSLMSSGWPTSPTSESPPASASWLRSSMRAAARSWATRSPGASTRSSHWRR